MNRSYQPENHGAISTDEDEPVSGGDEEQATQPQDRREVNGPPGPEPTCYGDWEKAGRCIDF